MDSSTLCCFKPSAYIYGCQYVEKMVRAELSRANLNILADQLIAIIQNTDVNVLNFLLTLFFDMLEDKQITNKQQQAIRQCLKSIITRFQDHPQFRNIIISFFDRLESFPVNILTNLFGETAFALTIHACFSIHSEASLQFLETKILPKLIKTPTFFVSNDLLYELCSLNLKSLNLEPLFSRSYSPTLSFYQSKYSHELLTPIMMKSTEIPISLRSVMMESDIHSLTSQERVKQLFSFFADFNEEHAAIFVLSLVVPDSDFKNYLDKLDNHQRSHVFGLYKDILYEKKIDFNKMVYSLDQPFDPLPTESCASLFSCLCCFFDKQLIPSAAFTREWKNKPLQFSILSAMTRINLPNLDFSKGVNLVNMHHLELQTNIFSNCNNCWLSLDFTERIIALVEYDKPALEKLLDPLLTKYPALLVALLGQTNIKRTEPIMDVAVAAISKVLQLPPQILAVLWRSSSPFVKDVITAFYERQPIRIELIYDAIGENFQALIDSDNVPLATDLAFTAASTGKYQIGDFISSFCNKYTISALPKIIDFVKSRITESMPTSSPIQTSVLNSFFAYLQSNFESYPIEIRAFILRAYQTCEACRQGLQKLVFDLKIPPAKLHEIKQTASMNFSKLLGDEMDVLQFFEMLQQYRTTDPTLYSCMVHFLLVEFKYIERHNLQDVEKLANLVGKLIITGSFSSKQMDLIFGYLRSALNQAPNTAELVFSSEILHCILPKISDYPQFVFDIIHESNLRTTKPSLFEKVQKIGQLLNEPLQSNRTNVLTVHPSLKQFELLKSPSPRVAKAIQEIITNPSSLNQVLQNFPPYRDWIAYSLVCTIQDTPKILNQLVQQILLTGSFKNIVFKAAAAQVHQHILSTEFDQPEGAFLRRRLQILGRLIGSLTLAVNRPILGRFLDLKQILYYSFAQGKLYGVVPFVVAVFLCSSQYFMPPNPYTSSILSILASIYTTDSLKLLIKHHINTLFTHMKVTMSMFSSSPMLFPDKINNNFDFLMPPFSLPHILSAPDVERLIGFDEIVFNQFLTQHVIIPDCPILENKPELKDKMRKVVLQQAIHYVRQEATNLSKVAASTAIELVLKDFMTSNDTDLMMECAATITKQLSAGLTIFTAPAKISRQLCQALRQNDEGSDPDWVDTIAQLNYDWICQLLRDIVRLRAWKSVQAAVEHSEEARNSLAKKARMITGYPNSMKSALFNQLQQVYADLNDLSLSVQPYPMMELQQNKEKMVPIDPEFDSYMQRIQKTVPYDISRANGQIDGQTDDMAVSLLIQACPDISGSKINSNRFRSIIKTVLKAISKSSQIAFEQIVCQVLEIVVKAVPISVVVKTQPYVVSWIRNSIRSPYIINELLHSSLLTVNQLDRVLTEVLNVEPLNARNACFAIRLLHYLIFELATTPNMTPVAPSQMISTLSVVTAMTPGQLESAAQMGQITTMYEELLSVYNSMDAPAHQLSAASKLQTVSTFDPVDELKDAQAINELITNFKIMLQNPRLTESEVIKATKEMLQYNRELFICLFNPNESDVTSALQFIDCVREAGEINSQWKNILSALHYVVNGNANVIGFDMRKNYTIMRTLMSLAFDDPTLLQTYVHTLHQMRPLLMPSFIYCWVELATDKQIVYALLSRQQGWVPFSVILADLAATVTMVESSSNEVFLKCYKALLRFILVLIHDFRDFLCAVCPMIISIIPFQFTQLRNIILSATPTSPNDTFVFFSNEELKAQLPPRFTSALKSLIDENNSQFDEQVLKSLQMQMESKCDNPLPLVRCLVNYITVQLQTLKQSDTIEETISFEILSAIFEHSSNDLAASIVNVLLDKLRYDCRETSAFVRLIIALFKTDVRNSALGICELIARFVFERASTPPPHPYGLIQIVKELVTDADKTSSIWALPISSHSETVLSFLNAAKTVFLAKIR